MGGNANTWLEDQRVKKLIRDAENFEFQNERSDEDGFCKARRQAENLKDKTTMLLLSSSNGQDVQNLIERSLENIVRYIDRQEHYTIT